MTKEELTNAKFDACMTHHVNRYMPFETYSEKSLNEFDFEQFNDIMKNAGLDEFSTLLFQYFKNILDLNELNREAIEHSKIFDFEENSYRLDILKAIRFFISKPKDLTISFTLTKSKNKYVIRDNRLVAEIEDYITSLFNKRFNEMYSHDEADLELQKAQNESWASKLLGDSYEKESGTRVAYYSDIKDNKIFKYTNDNEDITGLMLKKDIQRRFMNSFQKTRELTIESIDQLIQEYDDRMKNRYTDNRKMVAASIIAWEIADLIQVKEYNSSTTSIDIEEIKIRNSDLRTIFTLLDYWGFMPPRERNSSTPEKYLRITLNQTRSFLPAEYYDKRTDRLVKLKSQISPL